MVPSLPDPQFTAKLRDVGVRCQRAINAHVEEARPLLERIGVPEEQSLQVLLLIGSIVGAGTTPRVAPLTAAPEKTEKPKTRGRRRARRTKKSASAKGAVTEGVTAKVETHTGKKPAVTITKPHRGGVKKGTLQPGSKMAAAVKFASTRQAFKVEEIVSALGISRDEAHKLLSQGRKGGRFTKVAEGTWRGTPS